MEAPRARNPQAVLFACGLNSVRSPMAESLLQQMFPQGLYVRSAGVKKGELDPFAVSVMAELGQDISSHKPQTFEELEDWEGAELRSHHHAVAGGAPQGAGSHPHARRRCRILADAGSDRHQRQPRAEARRLPRGLRRPVAAHPPPLCQGRRGKPVRRGEGTSLFRFAEPPPVARLTNSCAYGAWSQAGARFAVGSKVVHPCPIR
ncbi:hypothetical protein ACVIM9_005611 [Bradyrhizobium sp. USDA 4520]